MFVETSRHEIANRFRQGLSYTYPIGSIGNGIEVHFLHYKSAEEAKAKWERRAARVGGDVARLFVKFDDRDGTTPDHLQAFDSLPLEHKVCFHASPQTGLRCGVPVRE